jgi:hypothetical protein
LSTSVNPSTLRLRYKVRYFDGACPFICRDARELIDQLCDADDLSDIRIETIIMDDAEMDALPEFEGP